MKLETRNSLPPLGLYLSVPFCRSKCSFCNFASGVFSSAQLTEYADLLAREISLLAAAESLGDASISAGDTHGRAPGAARQGRGVPGPVAREAGGAALPRQAPRQTIDTLYWGGGTPSLLPPDAFATIMHAVHANFTVAPTAEHTVEVAPSTLTPTILDAFNAAGVNRLSFGAQSFQDDEVRAVGRLHRRSTVIADLARARAAGFTNLSLDLIAGLPHQTPASWRDSLDQALATGVPHISVYMLEVDDDSRLGRELLAGGQRYHAHTVPSDDAVADAYETACETLDAAGIAQYEISNFARPGFASRHNERYWLRQPYLGVGLDAHSFLDHRRWANPDDLEAYLTPLRNGQLPRAAATTITPQAAAEERCFLGLRRNAGIPADLTQPPIASLVVDGLLAQTRAHPGHVSLTPRGRLLSNRVFAELLT